MILMLRQFPVDCQPATGEVKAMGFVGVTFEFSSGVQACLPFAQNERA
jgi:hypothetical protein